MENIKTIKGRIQHKHGTEADWYAAGTAETPFCPLEGELIVYDPDAIYKHPRTKYGAKDADGKLIPVHLLPWAADCDESIGLEFELINDDKEYSVKKVGTCTDTNVVIPKGHCGKPVTQLGDCSLENLPDNVVSVILPNTIELIASMAFSYSPNLESVFVPRSVTNFSYCFEGCEHVTIFCEADVQPEGWDDDWNSYNHPVIWGCVNDFIGVNKKLNDYQLQTNETLNRIIYGGSFDYVPSEGLEYSVSTDGTYASFCGLGTCSDANITIASEYDGKPVTRIAYGALYEAFSVTSIYIPSSIYIVEEWGIVDCFELNKIYCEADTLPEGLAESINWSPAPEILLNCKRKLSLETEAQSVAGAINELNSKVNEEDRVGAVVQVEDYNNIPDNPSFLYRYNDSNLYEVVEKYNESSGGSHVYYKNSQRNSTSASVQATTLTTDFDSALSEFLTFTSGSELYPTYYADLDFDAIRIGKSKGQGTLTINANTSGVAIFHKYFSINSGVPGTPDANSVVLLNGVEHNFVGEEDLEVPFEVGEQTFASYNGSSGRIFLKGFVFGEGEAEGFYTYDKYELARTEEVNELDEKVEGYNTKLSADVLTNKQNIEKSIKALNTLQNKMGNVQISDVVSLPTASEKQINRILRCENKLYQCYNTGEGTVKECPYNLTGSSEITAEYVSDAEKMAAVIKEMNMKDIVSEFYPVKLFRNNGSIKLGSGSSTGTLDMDIAELVAENGGLKKITFGTKAYNNTGSVFEVWLGSERKIGACKDTTAENLLVVTPAEGEIPTNFGICTHNSYTNDEGVTTAYDCRGIVTRLIVEIGDIAYEWVPISDSSKTTEEYSEGLQYELSSDETYYIVTGMGTCEDEILKIPPVYKNLPVKSIAECAFQYVVDHPDLDEGVTSGGNNLHDIVRKVIVPDSITSIYDFAFSVHEEEMGNYPSTLEEVILPDSIENLGPGIFYGCSNLKQVNWPRLMTVIGDDMFAATSLKNFVIPNWVTHIGAWSFANCTWDHELVIPNSVTTISDEAFWYCHIEKMIIPLTTNSIGAYILGDDIQDYEQTIYCCTESQPEGWDQYWNATGANVVWGFANDFISINEKIDSLDIGGGTGGGGVDWLPSPEGKPTGSILTITDEGVEWVKFARAEGTLF